MIDNQEELYPSPKCVSGYFENQIELEQTNDRSDYTNDEINECLGSYFRFFGQKDMDIIYLYFISRKKQEQVMDILKKTQPAISYDVTRIKKQIDFVIKMMASIDDFIMFITDKNNNIKTSDRQMLTIFFYSTSIVKTSKLLGINNVTCRSHLNNIINKLLPAGHVDMYVTFKYILNNLNNIKKKIK